MIKYGFLTVSRSERSVGKRDDDEGNVPRSYYAAAGSLSLIHTKRAQSIF
jgi:hypothetical protein